MAQSRKNKTDFFKTIDVKTRDDINKYFKTFENSLKDIGKLTQTVNRLNATTFTEDVKINTKDITCST